MKLLSYIQDSARPSSRVVLGKEVMEAVWADMRRTQLPSWISTPPHNWGLPGRGKLSADEWRIICLIFLPITLIRLWHEKTGREKHLLKNFMDLVNATRIATSKVSSTLRVQLYNEFIFRYVKGLQELYPDKHLLPVHHAALHLGHIMELFGPIHSHNAAFFERYIKFLHRMNINQKPGLRAQPRPVFQLTIFFTGELESTFMKTSSYNANLHAILADDDALRKTVHEMASMIQSMGNEDARGFHLATLLDPSLPESIVASGAKPFELADPEYQLLRALINRTSTASHLILPRQAISVRRISTHGLPYSAAGEAPRDSNIIFQDLPAMTGNQKVGVIESIFGYEYRSAGDQLNKEYYLSVRERLRVQGQVDPYPEFGFAAGFLCEADTTRLHVIALPQVLSHCSLQQIADIGNRQLVHVMPLDRVCRFAHVICCWLELI